MARAPRNDAVDRQVADSETSDVSSLSQRRSRKTSARAGGAHPEAGDGRAVVTLSPAVAAATRRMGEQMGGVGTTEVVRRGLILLDLLLSLDETEELVVRRTDTKDIERLRFAWDTF